MHLGKNQNDINFKKIRKRKDGIYSWGKKGRSWGNSRLITLPISLYVREWTEKPGRFKVVRSGTTACFKEKELKSNDSPDPSEIGIYIVAPIYSYVMYYKKYCSEAVDRQNRIKDVTCSLPANLHIQG